jgi:glycosyltransferase involved in cell wall biosynthesis
MRNRRPLLKRLSLRFIESGILRNAGFVHFASEAERAEAEQLGIPFRSVVIPNPLPEIPRIHCEREPATVLFLSRFDPIKGLDLLLPAFEQVRTRIPEAKLILAGSGDPAFTQQLRNKTNEAIAWPGFLQNEAKYAALQRATVFVLPSYSESFGVAAAEAMAVGCPVIVSDCVAIHDEIAQARAGLVVPCEVPALAAAIEKLLPNPDLRKQLTARAQQLARERYGLQSVVAKLIEAYSALTNGPSTSDPVAVTSTSSSIRKPPTGL